MKFIQKHHFESILILDLYKSVIDLTSTEYMFPIVNKYNANITYNTI